MTKDWLKTNGGWLIAAVTLLLSVLATLNRDTAEASAQRVVVAQLVVKVDKLANEMHELAVGMDVRSRDFWSDKWPKVERNTERIDQIDKRLTLIEAERLRAAR